MRCFGVMVLTLLQAERADATQIGTVFGNLHVLASAIVELVDRNDYQALALPTFTPRPAAAATFVALVIESVYSGEKYQDTCISEVRSRAD